MNNNDLREQIDLITPEELAELVGVKIGTLNQWRFNRRGPDFVSLGKKVFYQRADVEAWIAMNKTITNRSVSEAA